MPDPRCPATASLHVVASAGDVREIALPCDHWRRKGNLLLYADRSGSAGGVKLVVVSRRRLIIRMGSPALTPPRGPLRYLEVGLTVGTESYCGRFSGFLSNTTRHVLSLGPTGACLSAKPNLLVVVLDDVRFDGVDQMPELARIAAEGVSFDNAFTPQSSCTSSRASILTGLYSLRHHTYQVGGVIGGADLFRETGDDQQTIAVWLHDAGYRTGLFGKYLNDYGATEADKGPNGSFYVPPGWDRWWAFAYNEHYGGVYGKDYQIVEENHLVTSYSDHASDAEYSTDVSAIKLRAFVRGAVAAGERFFAYWTPYAAHGDTPQVLPAPAQRHAGLFATLPPWRPASWDETDTSDKPRWMQTNQAREDVPGGSGPILRSITDVFRELQYETLLSADEQLGLIMQQLRDLGIDDDTLVLVTSDNGMAWGEHHVWANKGCAYDECQRVAMHVRYPRRVPTAPANVAATVLNNDIAPSLAAYAGVPLPYAADGESLQGWLGGLTPAAWRSDYILSHWRTARGDSLTYAGQVSDGDQIRVYYGNTRAQPRASVVLEFDAGGGVAAGALRVPIGVDSDASWSAFAAVLRSNAASVRVSVNTTQHRVGISPVVINADTSVYIWEEVDQGSVIDPIDDHPDMLGVRDVANGFTWVEYETGERELYDLATDPDQLDNRAYDPTYGGMRQRYETRLGELLTEVAAR